jgi:hypothetical protein
MERNMGKTDRIVRLVLGIVVAVFAVVLELYPLLFLTVFLWFTVVTSFCGFYKLFGLSTCQTDEQ